MGSKSQRKVQQTCSNRHTQLIPHMLCLLLHKVATPEPSLRQRFASLTNQRSLQRAATKHSSKAVQHTTLIKPNRHSRFVKGAFNDCQQDNQNFLE
jgi:hypothetical protein